MRYVEAVLPECLTVEEDVTAGGLVWAVSDPEVFK